VLAHVGQHDLQSRIVAIGQPEYPVRFEQAGCGDRGAPAAALGLIEGISDGLAGAGRFVGGALADDPQRRRTVAVGGYLATAILSALIGTTTSVVQAGVLRGAAWAARGLRVPARNALLADVVPEGAYGRAYGFERTMDNLGAIVGPLLAFGLVSVFSVRSAILVSVVPGLLAAAIVYAIRQAKLPRSPSARSCAPASSRSCGASWAG
jgi:sugar phosphate permease